MIPVFDIRKNKKDKINQSKVTDNYKKLSNLSSDVILKLYNSNINGLDNKIAKYKLNQKGLNIVIKEDKKNWVYFLVNAFKDQFIIILLFLSIINFFIGDKLGSLIIVLIALISALIRFYQDYGTYKFNKKLKSKLFSCANVIRNGKEKIISTEYIVEGDIVRLNAGSIIPADLYLLESKDLFVNQSAFTGETIPIEKKSFLTNNSKDLFQLENICYMGSNVISGSATGLVINTGFDTYLGLMGQNIKKDETKSNFDIGMKKISDMLIRYMIVVCFIVMIVNGIIKKDFYNAILFALSVAVGITPSMLPMIVNVNLTKGTKSLAKKKTLVKKIESIQNLGAIDILCTDKTGTLTEGNIILQKYVDVNGKETDSLVRYAYINSYYSTGLKNIVDKAIITYAKGKHDFSNLEKVKKIDEIPFDYERKKESVVIELDGKHLMLTKGAMEVIIDKCSKINDNNKIKNMTNNYKEKIKTLNNEIASKGMQVIALAYKNEYRGKDVFDVSDENNMIFLGLMGFLDPVKKDAKKVLNDLYSYGIKTKILTGDNYYATKNIAESVGLTTDKILLGEDLDKLTDEKLELEIENIDVYARLNPLQKERIVSLFRKNGHVVGYMGDGVNDAPSLAISDVGISVNTATDIAKESSDIILLEKNLKVILDGVIEGRKVYGNIIKYIKMALSADFGDVFSIMISSIFIPFLPLLPIQMLIQDFIYDFSQIGIPYDNVDKEFLIKPKKWETEGLSRFMKIMGIASSIIDVLSFIIFWFVFKYNSVEKQAYFQTAWFVMCLISELIIIHFVRTSKKPFIESVASKELMSLTLLSLILTIITPILLHNFGSFNFIILPFKFYFIILLLVILYAFIVSIIKNFYKNKYGEWL